MTNPQLMEAFDFTPDELRINRAGQLSARQKSQLERDDLQQTLDIGCALLTFVMIASVAFGACALLFNVEALVESLSYVLPFVGGAVAVLIVAALIFNARGVRDRRGRPDVAVVDGTITISEEAGGYDARQFLMIGDYRFRITPQMFDALKEFPPDAVWRIYFAERMEKVLSIEISSTG